MKKTLPLDERTITNALAKRLLKKFGNVIDEVDYPDNTGDTWIYLKTGFCNDPESHIIHESIYGAARMALEGVSSCECFSCTLDIVKQDLDLDRPAPDWLFELVGRSVDLDISIGEMVKLARRTMAADSVTRTLILGSSDASLRRLAAAS